MKFSQPQKVALFLKENSPKKFTAREIAQEITRLYPDDYTDKRNNPRFNSEQDFINQIIAEIGANKGAILKFEPKIQMQDKPRPRVYWFDEKLIVHQEHQRESITQEETFDQDHDEVEVITLDISKNHTEHDLYPILIEYLANELHLNCLRIDEKKSSNRRGTNGNQWLHPDLVAMQALDQHWNNSIRTCVKLGSGQNVLLWSFEVKKTIDTSNLRSSFFQAVSNSSWANEGYLVAASIAPSSTLMEELKMLSTLHGIGFILLNTENPSESDILLPARRKQNVDWQSVNRIVVENADFKNFIDLVSMYYQTGQIRPKEWNH